MFSGRAAFVKESFPEQICPALGHTAQCVPLGGVNGVEVLCLVKQNVYLSKLFDGLPPSVACLRPMVPAACLSYVEGPIGPLAYNAGLWWRKADSGR